MSLIKTLLEHIQKLGVKEKTCIHKDLEPELVHKKGTKTKIGSNSFFIFGSNGF